MWFLDDYLQCIPIRPVQLDKKSILQASSPSVPEEEATANRGVETAPNITQLISLKTTNSLLQHKEMEIGAEHSLLGMKVKFEAETLRKRRQILKPRL